ncbi:hypothetical protein [Halobacillus sp. KGW1]|uniref:hypothetical protein n=1 Tax=Halobacillus sp. KGW1 TaxID=1793726 RepID=UPI000B0B5F88|nr:hypothetical protein [Halobacillus sp. KGW1]
MQLKNSDSYKAVQAERGQRWQVEYISFEMEGEELGFIGPFSHKEQHGIVTFDLYDG